MREHWIRISLLFLIFLVNITKQEISVFAFNMKIHKIAEVYNMYIYQRVNSVIESNENCFVSTLDRIEG